MKKASLPQSSALNALAFPPVLPTALVGRAAELETIAQRLTAEHVRMLTLVGPAGVGKTRLALEAMGRLAGRFPDGAIFVDLSPVGEARGVLPALTAAFGFTNTGKRPLMERLCEYLQERDVLMVLDNFEHLLSAARPVSELLAAAPRLRVLVTSRIPLRLRREQTLRIYPLAVPDLDLALSIDELLQIPSMALFVDRAQAQRADFAPTGQQIPLLVGLIRQLDGLPLAIELAAARTNVLPLAVIARRLEDRLQLLQWEAGDLPERQRSLEAAIGWSYDLLTDEEQRLFRQLGVFVGRVSLDALAAVLGTLDQDHILDGMIALAEKSLVLPALHEEDPEPSFGMLETVRQYACEQLRERGELEAARDAHARYFLQLAERAMPELTGHQQRSWYSLLEREHDNLRLALRRFREQNEQEAALRLATALGWFWLTRGYHSEGRRWLEDILAGAQCVDPALKTRALLIAGLILTDQNEIGRAKALLLEALALAEQGQDPRSVAEARTYLGGCAVVSGDAAAGVPMLEAAVERWNRLDGAGTSYQVGLAYGYLAVAAFQRNDLASTADLLFQTLARHDASGDQHSASATRFYLAPILAERGDLQQGIQLLREGLAASRPFNDRLLLSLGVEATLCLATAPASLEQRVRLLGARDALHETTGLSAGVLAKRLKQNVETLREQSRQDELSFVYGEGRKLAPPDITDLALAVVELAADGTPAAETSSRSPAVESPLSEREQEVLRLVAEGLTSKQIGQQLFLSHRTVDHHLTSIYNKLGVDSRAQAVAVASRDGLF